MELLVHDYLSEYWYYIVLVISILALLGVLIYFLYQKFFINIQSFKENFTDAKQIQMAICIDLDEKKVEKYYLFDQTNKNEIVDLDEFLVHFDKSNADKLKSWLSLISRVTDFNRTRRNEFVMYDKNNQRRVYLAELERYDAENKRYHFIFKDMTDSAIVSSRAGKISSYFENEVFFEKANEKLLVCDEDSNNYLIAIKYKEHSYASKELQYDLLRLLEDSVFNALNNKKFDNDLLCVTGNGSFLLFSANVANEKKYKHNIRKMLLECSKEYNIIANKFSYTVTLVAGYTKINRHDHLSVDKILEAETAADTLINKNRFSDRLQLFDEHIQNVNTEHNNKLLAVERVITQNQFSVVYEPIIKVKTKTVSGYSVKIELPSYLNMTLEEFLNFAKQRSYRVNFFYKIFENIKKHPDNKKKNFYLSFDFDNLSKVMEAYAMDESFKTSKIYFCLEFSNATMQHTDLITIEKAITLYKETHKVKFGLTYNTIATLYLNEIIYMKFDLVLMTGQFIEQSLDQYSNSSLLDVYSQIALKYNHEVIGLNVSSLAIYETLMHYNVGKVSGMYLTPYVENDKVSDKSFLKQLEEIENKTY